MLYRVDTLFFYIGFPCVFFTTIKLISQLLTKRLSEINRNSMRKRKFTFKSMKALMLAMVLMASIGANAQVGKRSVRDDGTVVMEQNSGEKRSMVKKSVVTKGDYTPSAEASFYDGFDTYDDWTTGFGDWTLVNGNEPHICIGFGLNGTPDGYQDFGFPREATPYAAIIFNPSQTGYPNAPEVLKPSDMYIPANSGQKYAAMFKSYTGGDWPKTDKWMITPKITIGESENLSFFGRSGDFSATNQKLEILVSSTGTATTDFTKIADLSMRNTEWIRFNYLLSDHGYANQDVYIAIRDVSDPGTSFDDFSSYSFIDDVETVPVSTEAMPEMLVSEWDAGVTAIGAEAVSEEFILRNIGQANLTVSAVNGLEGSEFTTSIVPADINLAWQETYTFTVTYSPTNPGSKSLEAVIVTNVGNITFTVAGQTADEGFEGIEVPEGTYTVTDLPEGWRSINADGGVYPWVVQKGHPHSGTKALRSDGENGFANDDWIITPALDIQAAKTDVLAFYAKKYWWDAPSQFEVRLSTTGVEMFDFNVLLGTETTTTDYERKEYNLDAYDGQVVYVAIRNIKKAEVDGTVFLDDFFLPAINVPDVDLSVLSFTGNVRPSLDNEEVYKVNVKNAGKLPVDNYKVQLLKVVDGAADEILAQTTIIETLNAGDDITIDVAHTFTVQEEQGIYAKVVLNIDENASNNKSKVYTIKVLDANLGSYTAGDGQVVMNAPIYSLGNKTFTEVIYNHSELGFVGQINELAFYNNFLAGDALQQPVRIWLGVTDRTSFSVGNDLIGPSDLTLVFDGLVDLPKGQNRIDIAIQSFMYMGGNLVMLIERDSEIAFQSSQTFFGAASTENCTVEYGSFNGAIEDITNLDVSEYKLRSYIPKTSFIYIDEFGGVSGFVKSADVKLENAEVSVVNTHFNYITTTDGMYEFMALVPETYVLSAECHGYYDALVENVVIEKDIEIIQDIEMTALPKLSVSGLIKGSDGSILENAIIKLEGYEELHRDTTEADGLFAFANIYGEKTYVVSVKCEGYVSSTTELVLTTSDNDMGELILNEIAYRPEYVSAIVDDNNETALINWYAPWSGTSTLYQYDTDTHANSYAFSPLLNTNFWMGNKFDVADKGAVTKIAVHGWSGAPYATEKVTVEIFSPEEGVVWASEPFLMPGKEWLQIDVPQVRFDGKFYIMVHCNNLSSNINPLHFDASGTSVAYYYSAAEGFVPWEQITDGYAGAFRIRAQANIYGKSVKLESAKAERKYNTSVELPKVDLKKTDVSAEFTALKAEKNDSKVLESYKVFRGLKDDAFENYVELTSGPITDTSYVDNAFGGLDNNVYKYAVTAIYTNGIESDPTYSNLTHNSVLVPLTFNITTSEIGENNVEGAVVYATNYDGYSAHAYEVTVPANGVVDFTVATGRYDIKIQKPGFNTYEEINTDIAAAQTFNVELQEALSAPENLMVLNKENGRAVFSWNNSFSDIFVDFENGEYPEDWTLIDADGDGHNWGLIMAGTGAVSGDFSAVSHSFDNGSGQPLSPENYMVSPKVYVGPNYVVDFYAWAQDGNFPAEKFKVKISTSGMEPEDFTYTVVDHTLTANEDGMPVPDHFTVDLSEFAGRKIYIAFVHDSYDQNAMSIDNIFIGQNQDAKSLINYEISLSGESLGSTTDKQIDFNNLTNGQTYVAGVKAVYTSGESVEAQFEFVYTPGIVEYILQVGTEANCDLDIVGAAINFENQNGDLAQMYNEVLPDSKELQFMIVPGVYDLVITKAGFVTYELTGVEISANTTEVVLMEEDRKKPLNLEATDLSTTSAKLTWDMESNEKSIIGFRTYLDGEEQGLTTEMEYVFTDLVNGTYYEFGVKTLYTTGESEMNVLYHAFVYNGIESNENELTVYPVPARNELFVEWNAPSLTIEVYNLIGQIQKVIEATSTKTSIDVSNLNNGIYILKLKSEGQEVVRKIAVRK